MRLILSHFKEFLILDALPKSFISDFVLKSGKTPYKKYGRYSRFKKGQLMLTLSYKNDVTKSTFLVPILKNYKNSLLEFNNLLEIIGR